MSHQDTDNEENTLLLAIKENLHQEGLHKIHGPDNFRLYILDNPAMDFAAMVFAGEIRLVRCTAGFPYTGFFELADPEVFQKLATAIRSYHGP